MDSPSSHKLVYLESLRGLAALAVVLGHLIAAFYPVAVFHPLPMRDHEILSLASIIFSGAYAVRFFFFLSGFVLSISYFKKRQIAVLSSAAVRRYPRLVIPVLASMLFAWTIQETYGYRNVDATNLMHRPEGDWLRGLYPHHLTFLVALKQGTFDVFFNPNFDPAKSLNVVLWTMPIELAGSFYVFSYLALFGQLQKRWIIYVLAALGLHFFSQPFLLDFLCGIALSDLFVFLETSGRKLKIPMWTGLLMLMAGAALGALSVNINDEGHLLFPMPCAFNLPTVASLLIVVAALYSSGIQAFLEHSILAFLGRISFPLYLFHFPIIFSFGCGLFICCSMAGFSYTISVIFSSVLAVTLSIVASWAAYYAVELPAIHVSGRFARFFLPPSFESSPGIVDKRAKVSK